MHGPKNIRYKNCLQNCPTCYLQQLQLKGPYFCRQSLHFCPVLFLSLLQQLDVRVDRLCLLLRWLLQLCLGLSHRRTCSTYTLIVTVCTSCWTVAVVETAARTVTQKSVNEHISVSLIHRYAPLNDGDTF
jgi:hypothetical protein